MLQRRHGNEDSRSPCIRQIRSVAASGSLTRCKMGWDENVTLQRGLRGPVVYRQSMFYAAFLLRNPAPCFDKDIATGEIL